MEKLKNLTLIVLKTLYNVIKYSTGILPTLQYLIKKLED